MTPITRSRFRAGTPDPLQTPWQRYLDEVVQAGYRYSELGPFGYLPTDPGIVRDEYQRRGLTLTGGTVFAALHQGRDALERAKAGCDAEMAVIGPSGARYVVILPEGYTDLNGKLTAVELVADESGKPSARLRLERSDGRSTVPTRAGQALALAVPLKVPLLVAEALLTGEKGQTAAASESKPGGEPATDETSPVGEADVAPKTAQPIPVPEAFLRAFDE